MNPEYFLTLLCLLLFNSIVCAGWYVGTRYEYKRSVATFSLVPKLKDIDPDSKMIGWWISFYLEKYLGKFWSKPFINCLPCMASVHSIYIYWYFMPHTFESWITYIFYVPALAFVNSFTARVC